MLTVGVSRAVTTREVLSSTTAQCRSYCEAQARLEQGPALVMHAVVTHLEPSLCVWPFLDQQRLARL